MARRIVPAVLILFAAFAGSALFIGNHSFAPRRSARAGRSSTLLSLPLSFEPNQGQTVSSVQFMAHGPGYSLFLSHTQADLSLAPAGGSAASTTASGHAQSTNVSLRLLGANPSSAIAGRDELPGRVNYLTGNDRANWHTNIPTYSRVEYTNVYPGVNMVFYGDHGQLNYDFDLAPGANPQEIRIAVNGASALKLDARGDLVIETPGGSLIQKAPVLFQDIEGHRSPVQGRYVLLGNHRIGLQTGSYDQSQPLVIDPALLFSTYLGGSSEEKALGVAVDQSGATYVTGWTYSTDFPITDASGTAFQTLGATSSEDVFVSKFSPDGSSLVYSTYLGSWNDEEGLGIAVNGSGEAYVTGWTTSYNDTGPGGAGPGFPVTSGAFQKDLNCPGCGPEDAFLSVLNASGTGLVYSTYLGGGEGDWGQGIAVDAAGNAYVTGYTGSYVASTSTAPSHTDFPLTSNAYQSSWPGSSFECAFIAEFNPTLSATSSLVYSTLLGGGNYTEADGIAVDDVGNVYVAGFTESTGFPTTAGAYETSTARYTKAFVAKLNPNVSPSSALVYSTFLNADHAYGIAVDAQHRAYVTGDTSPSFGALFGTTAGAYQVSIHGQQDAYVVELNASGSALDYASLLGGTGQTSTGEGGPTDLDSGRAVAVDTSGNVYIAGITDSADFPSVDPVQSAYGGGYEDAFVAEFNPQASGSSSLVYSSPLGGSSTDEGHGIAVNASSEAIVVGWTESSDFPMVSAYQSTSPTTPPNEAFVAKIAAASVPSPTPTSTATATPTPSPTPTASPTSTPNPTATPTATLTPAPSPTATAIATATTTPSPTATPTSTPTASPTPTSSPTPAPSPTSTPSPTATASPTPAPTFTPTPARPPDRTPPTWRSGSTLTAVVVNDTTVRLTWPLAQDDRAVSYYRLYRNGLAIAWIWTSGGSSITVTIQGEVPGDRYLFAVDAVDDGRNPTATKLTATVVMSTEPIVECGGLSGGAGWIASGSQSLFGVLGQGIPLGAANNEGTRASPGFVPCSSGLGAGSK